MTPNKLDIWLRKTLKKTWVAHTLKVALGLVITLAITPFKLDSIEYTGYDWQISLTPKPKPSGEVVLISIEMDTLKRLKREPEALDWAVVLQKLAQAEPSQIVSFINPTQIQGSYEDLTLLADLAGRLPFQFGADALPSPGVARLEPLAPPFDRIPIEPAVKTADKTVLAKDGVTRRLILAYENRLTLHPKLAEPLNHIHSAQGYSGAFDFHDSTQLQIRFREKGAFKNIKFADILEGEANLASLKGKIVLIGRDTLESAADYITTPISKNLLALSQLEMHANIIDTLILNQAPRLCPDWVRWLLTAAISILTIYVVLSLRPGKGLMLLFSTISIYLILSLLVFTLFRWSTPIAHPLVAVFICYYFVIPYRLILEHRRSWEYYEKNRLLTQVEELKSNFMRMMSHDLRTPLARIQGMSEILIKDATELSETQKLAVLTISESSEELTEFIGSILSLSRIESKEMKLQLRSRDINQLLRLVIRKTEYLAKRKNIEIVTELEPLFSIRADEDLLKTVFTNLLENAIKYADENTKVLVTSEEINNQLVVQVADQGRGIPKEDIEHIFDRFYRAKNSRVDTPGTGLGLYLARYFVELHNGQIEVESELNRGSTFSVRLPMNLDPETEHPEPGGLYV